MPTVKELPVCPDCGLIFDLEEDREAHMKQVCRSVPYYAAAARYEADSTPFMGAADRYPELEPPPGHEAWDPIPGVDAPEMDH